MRANQVFEAFGGVPALCEALAVVGYPRSASAVYRWDLPIDKGGAGGTVPTRAVVPIERAAAKFGIALPTAIERPPRDLKDMRELPLARAQPARREMAFVVDGQVWSNQLWSDFFAERSRQERFLQDARRFQDDLGGVGLLEGFAQRFAWYRAVTAMEKLDPASEHILKRMGEDPTIRMAVFATNARVAKLLAHRLASLGAVRLYLRTEPFMERRKLAEIANDASKRVLVLPPKVGPSLDFITEALFVDAAWSASANAAAVGRLKEGVRIRFAAITDTIDQDVQRVLRDAVRNAFH